MAEVKLRLNLNTEEVELVVDNEVALTSGKDVLRSWVDAINDKHKPEPSLDEPVQEKEVAPETPVTETTPTPVETADSVEVEQTPKETNEVDTTDQGTSPEGT